MPKAIPPTPPGKARKPVGTIVSVKQSAAFDTWLQRGLHEIFDDVAREPIPDALLKLIEEDRKR